MDTRKGTTGKLGGSTGVLLPTEAGGMNEVCRGSAILGT